MEGQANCTGVAAASIATGKAKLSKTTSEDQKVFWRAGNRVLRSYDENWMRDYHPTL
jgi:hypothetical protein